MTTTIATTPGRLRGEYMQGIRLVRLLRLLDRKGFAPLVEIVRDFGVSQKTVERDLRALRRAGENVSVERGDVVNWSVYRARTGT